MARPSGGWISGYAPPGFGKAPGVWSLRDVTLAQNQNLWFRDPISVPGLKVYLDGSDATTLYDATTGGSLVSAGGAIARWEDKSGNAAHATQATNIARPTRQTNLRNGRGGVRFNGTNHTMRISSLTLPTYCTTFVVSSTTIANGAKFFLEHGANVNSFAGYYFNGTNIAAWAFNRSDVLHYGPSTDGADWVGSGWVLATLTYDGTGRVYKNGVLVTAATGAGTARANTNITAALNIGSRNQSSLLLAGDIGAILIYEGALSSSVRQQIENWLLATWAI